MSIFLCVCSLFIHLIFLKFCLVGLQNQNQTQGTDTSFGSNGNGSGSAGANGSGSSSVFHPSFFMGLLSEGSPPKGTKAYSEKDLGSSMELIIKGESTY
jgi:hypothetical protein